MIPLRVPAPNTRIRQRLLMSVWLLLGLVPGCQPADSNWAVVHGVSMAPQVWGESRSFTCIDCGFPFRTNPDRPPPSQHVVCPNCGFRSNPWKEGQVLSGTTCKLRPIRDGGLSVRRGDIVAVQNEAGADVGLIKRVLGLPGETIHFQHGNLMVNNRLYRKSWKEFDQVKVLMFDSKYQPRSDHQLSPRPGPSQAVTGWRRTESGWEFRPLAGEPNDDQLVYRHWRCCEHAFPRDTPFPVEDLYAANQSLSRDFNVVDDFVLDMTWQLANEAHLTLTWVQGARRIRLELRKPEGQWRISVDDRVVGTGEHRFANRSLVWVEAGVFDDTLRVRLNGVETWQQELSSLPQTRASDRSNAVGQGTFMTWEATFGQGHGELVEMKLWRDLFYFADSILVAGSSLPAPLSDWQVPPDAVFVVGDNLPASLDSRHWEPASVPLDRLWRVGDLRPAN